MQTKTIIKTLTGGVVLAALTAIPVLTASGQFPGIGTEMSGPPDNPTVHFVKTCPMSQVALNLTHDKQKNVTKRKCVTQGAYRALKTRLKNHYNSGKGYDFDINDREVISAVINHELQLAGGMSIEKPTKEKIRQELLKLFD